MPEIYAGICPGICRGICQVLLHKLLGKICICQGGFGFDLLIDLQEKLQGNLPGNLLRKFLKIFFLREFAEEFATQLADETCRGISLGKFAENFAGGNFTFFPLTLCYCGKGSNSNPQKTLTGLLFVKSSCCGIMGITICRDEWFFLFRILIWTVWNYLLPLFKSLFENFLFLFKALFERWEIIWCPYSTPYLKMMVSYSKPYLNDVKICVVLIQSLIWKWCFLIWKHHLALFGWLSFLHEEGEKIRKHLDVKLHKSLFKNSICAY